MQRLASFSLQVKKLHDVQDIKNCRQIADASLRKLMGN